MLVLLALAVIARIKLKNFKVIPTGFQNVVEAVVETFDNFATNTFREKALLYSPLVFHGICICPYL